MGLGFGDRALRRFAERMNKPGRYHVFRSGMRYFLNGELVCEGPYRKRGHASAGAWIERDASGNVVAEDVVCFDEILSEADVQRRAGASLPSSKAAPRFAPPRLRTA